LIDVALSSTHGAQEDDLGGMVFGHLGDRDGIFVPIQPNLECARLAHG
jgi:hypothetical protein